MCSLGARGQGTAAAYERTTGMSALELAQEKPRLRCLTTMLVTVMEVGVLAILLSMSP